MEVRSFALAAAVFALTLPAQLLVYILLITQSVRFFLHRTFRNRFLSDHAVPVNGVDSVWALPSPTSPPSVLFSLQLNDTLLIQELKQRFQEQVLNVTDNRKRLTYWKLRKSLQCWAGSYVWLPEANFSIDDHVVEEPRCSSREQVFRTWSRVAALPFPDHLSPWSVHLIHVTTDSSRSMVVFRWHHSIADVLSFFRLLKSCLRSDARETGEIFRPFQPKPRIQKWLRIQVTAAALLGWPYLFLRAIAQRQRSSLQVDQLTGRKILRSTRPVDLGVFRAIKAATGASVNEVFLCAVSGALRKFVLNESATNTQPSDITAIVPVSMHSNADPNTYSGHQPLHNRISLPLIRLPLGIEDPLARLRLLQRNLRRLLSSVEIYVILVSMETVNNRIPASVRRVLEAKPGIQVGSSNVAGPPKPVQLFDRRVEEWNFWVPNRGTTGIGVTAFTYNEQMVIGLTVDEALVSNEGRVDAMCQDITSELNFLESIATEIKQQSVRIDC